MFIVSVGLCLAISAVWHEVSGAKLLAIFIQDTTLRAYSPYYYALITSGDECNRRLRLVWMFRPYWRYAGVKPYAKCEVVLYDIQDIMRVQ